MPTWFHSKRMLRESGLAVLFVLAASSARTSAQPCPCSFRLSARLHVNCSSCHLTELPQLPSDTTELHVQDNRLTFITPGLFDNLAGLRRVSLSGNPFHCDCRIQYLRNWLLKNKAAVSQEPVCSSPSSVAQQAVADLTDHYFSACAPESCAGSYYPTVMAAMLCCLIVLLLWSLRLAKHSTFTLYIDKRHSGFEADSLRSLRPKHRRRLHLDPSEVRVDTEARAGGQQTLANMDLLPQVLDALHKKHNIKIKAT